MLPTWVVLVAAVVVFAALSFVGVPLLVWTAAFAGLLLALGAPVWVWIVFAVPAVIANVPPLRRMVFTDRLVRWLVKQNLLPRISETERVALEAGTVWMDAELFSGRPRGKRLLDVAVPVLRADEQEFLDGPVEEVCRMVDDWGTWKDKDLPPELWSYLKTNRFFGMIVPQEYGGLGFSASGVSAVVHKLASRSFALSVTVMIPNSLGPGELLSHYGTDAQKKEFLPKLANGEHMPCFALTEPGAGSDAGSLSSKGVVFRGEDGELKLRLTWNKRYTSLATVATIIGLAFRLEDPDELLGKGKNPGITCALVPRSTPGVTAERRHDPLGVPFHNCCIEGEDVVVPLDTVIGGTDGVGRGWEMLMDCLSAGRGVTLPASSVANAKMMARVTGAYSAVRHQFGMPVGKFEGVEEPLARIGGWTYLMEASRRYTNAAVDSGEKPAVVSAIMKYHLTELSRVVTNDAMDVLAGAGISRGPRNLVANSYVGTPIAITVEGANILTRTMIVFGQGALRCHPYARDLVMALESDDLAAADRVLMRHVGHVWRNSARAKLLWFSRGLFASSPVSGPAAKHWRKLSWASATFAVFADIAMMTLGGRLKRCEKLTGRLGDMLSWMYLGAATLHRFETDGRREEDRPLMEWAMESVFARFQEALEGTLGNFPAPFFGPMFRRVLAPAFRLNGFGAGPSDALGAKVAAILRTSSEQRERLHDGLYLPESADEALGRLERALRLTDAADAVSRKIKDAVRAGTLPKARPAALLDEAVEKNVVTAAEAQSFRDALAAQADAVEVDSFAAEAFTDSVPVPGIPVKEPASL